MLGNFNPSPIVGKIYSLMDKFGAEPYNSDLRDLLTYYLSKHFRVEFQMAYTDWPNGEGGTCAIAFSDNGHPQLVMFDYKN